MSSKNLRSCALSRAWMFCVGSILFGLTVFLSQGGVPSAAAQSTEHTRRTDLPRIHVTTRKKKAARRSADVGQRGRNPLPPRVTPRVASEPARTPLNTNTVAESASRLGLTPRETPASVEVIDQQTMQERG